MRYRGTELGASEVGVLPPFSTDWHSVSGSSQTASMSLTQSDLARLGPVLAGQDIVVSPDALSVAVAPSTMHGSDACTARPCIWRRRRPKLLRTLMQRGGWKLH